MADELEASACMCEPYPGWRAPEAEVVREQQELRQCWQGVKQALHQAYQQAGLSLGEALARQVAAFRDERATPSEAQVRSMVSRLRRRDPHRLLQCLKYQAQLFIVESRLRMLHHVVASTTSTESSHGSRLEDSLVAEYTKLRHAWEELNPLLEELVRPSLVTLTFGWGLLAGDLAAEECSGMHERHACCLGTPGSEAQCPFAEAGLLGAAGEPSAMTHRSSALALHGASGRMGGTPVGPG
ncbi:hypothetical protein IscW_ISCW017198 [Ixodes scapularis]|uniref:Uncharacterized protein n=1 Tax=Ixodes scapularis TaxID=6945 RepID=B7P8R0_IXOSC|nr:hypothetical protein IscW_ISCW017198 [Ixodes scapularis]|eukprot:XP_002402567.1 hypothetical protein IscW_ISCW017198 [Ixodes scapularis]